MEWKILLGDKKRRKEERVMPSKQRIASLEKDERKKAAGKPDNPWYRKKGRREGERERE